MGRPPISGARLFAMSIVLEASILDELDGPETSGLGSLVVVARQHGIHLTVPQLIHDNVLDGNAITSADLICCATKAELVAKSVHLDWASLQELKKALPAIVRLKNGPRMVLLELRGVDDDLRVVLQDPNAGEDALLFHRPDSVRGRLDRRGRPGQAQLRDLPTKRNRSASALIAALIFRERRIVRDVAIAR